MNDTERLDWIESNCRQPLSHNRKWFAGSSNHPHGHDTLREAIDAAMKNAKCKPDSFDISKLDEKTDEEIARHAVVSFMGKIGGVADAYYQNCDDLYHIILSIRRAQRIGVHAPSNDDSV